MSKSALMTSGTASAGFQTGKGHCHEQVAHTAKALAGEFWEQMCTGERKRGARQKAREFANKFWKLNPDCDTYIATAWPEFIEAARGAMLILLHSRDTNEVMKAEIYDVLLKDGAVNPKTVSPQAAAAMAAKRPI